MSSVLLSHSSSHSGAIQHGKTRAWTSCYRHRGHYSIGAVHFQGTALINISIVPPGIYFEFHTPKSMRQLSTARVQTESLARIYVQSQTLLDRINSNRGKEKSKKPFRQHLKEDDLLGPCWLFTWFLAKKQALHCSPASAASIMDPYTLVNLLPAPGCSCQIWWQTIFKTWYWDTCKA